MTITPQIDNQLKNDIEIVDLPSKTYKLIINEDSNDRIIGYVDKLDAIKQAVYHILMTERYAYLIYGNNYGVDLAQYIGNGFDYLESTIQATLKEALTMDLRIKDVYVTDIEKISIDKALIKFNVISLYGNIQMEVNINV